MALIGTDLLRELVETVILTGRVKNAEPVSLILIGAPESGKTSVVLSKTCKNVQAFADITGRGIHYVIKNNKELTHIVINDMVATMSHKTSVNKYLISQLNAITEEGISSIATPQGIETFECGKRGIITSLTLDLVKDSRYWWNRIGFTSRMMPFCYRYAPNVLLKIKNTIDDAQQRVNGQVIKEKIEEFKIPERLIVVEYPQNYIRETRYIADARSAMMKEQGMRRLKQYHALIQANALLHSRKAPIVGEYEINFLKTIDLYVSYDQPVDLVTQEHVRKM